MTLYNLQEEGTLEMPSEMSREKYTVGWVCALHTEYVAAQEFLDKEHQKPDDLSCHDNNTYTLGEIKGHYVVIACLPDGQYGKSSSASVARDMIRSFPNIKIGLMVGIAGGAPGRHDIRLGDIVVATSVYDYTFGKVQQGGGFEATGRVNYTPAILRTAVAELRAQYERKGHQLAAAIDAVLERNPRLRRKYKKPKAGADMLFKSEVVHEESCGETCSQDPSLVVYRDKRGEYEDNPAIHHGVIGSTDQVMKDSLTRDKYIRDKAVICFEMEAAGLNHFPCLIIRGICDYSDSHKNDQWQGYAAMVAAAYSRDLLLQITPQNVAGQKKLTNLLYDIEADIRVLVQERTVEKNNGILKGLASLDYSCQHFDNFSRRVAGTGQWMLDSTNYNTWIDEKGKTLFCPGIPGAGKTILTSIVINDLHKQFPGRDVGIAYLYCNYQLQEHQEAETLLANLLKQFAAKLQPFPESLVNLRKPGHGESTPFKETLTAALKSVCRQYSRVFIIIDALDECQGSDGRVGKLLTGISTLQKTAGASVFVTSRHIPVIVDEFRNCLTSEISASNDDICKYIEDYMQFLPKFVQRRPELQNDIKAQILEAAEGM